MRILSLLTTFTCGGAEMLVCNLADAFTAQGHHATVAALSDAASVGNSAAIETRLVEQVRTAGGTAVSLHLKKRGLLEGGIALRGLLRREQPDVIHAHTARAILMLALARPAAPVILTHHNSRLSFHPALYRVFDRFVTGYVAISAECEATTRREVRRPVRFILNAAGPKFRAGAPREAPSDDPLFIAVGTISQQKDYPTLIRAARPLARMLAAHGRKPRIRIVGGGAELDSLRALVRAEGVEDLVALLGVRDDVPALLAEADVFVNCSTYEGLSVAMIEALMSGLPIVATDVAGNREIVTDGGNGRLCPPADPPALARAMASAVADAPIYSGLSSEALRSAAHFSIDRCAEAHLALYRDAIRDKHARA